MKRYETTQVRINIMSNIVISKEDFSKLSHSVQTEILNLFLKKQIIQQDELDGELTKKQVFDLIEGLSDKSKGVLKATVKFENNSINFNELLEELDTTEEDLKGVWSGLTKRTRNVANDSDLHLINWYWNEEDQSYTLTFHPTTYSHIVSYFK